MRACEASLVGSGLVILELTIRVKPVHHPEQRRQLLSVGAGLDVGLDLVEPLDGRPEPDPDSAIQPERGGDGGSSQGSARALSAGGQVGVFCRLIILLRPKLPSTSSTLTSKAAQPDTVCDRVAQQNAPPFRLAAQLCLELRSFLIAFPGPKRGKSIKNRNRLSSYLERSNYRLKRGGNPSCGGACLSLPPARSRATHEDIVYKVWSMSTAKDQTRIDKALESKL